MDERGDAPSPTRPEWLDPKWIALLWIGPGALTLIAYALDNGLFPQLVASASVVAFGLTTAVVLLIMATGVLYGSFSFAWLAILVGVLRSRNGKPIELSRSNAWLFSVMSALMLIILAATGLDLLIEGKKDAFSVLAYFLLSGFLVTSALSPAIHDVRVVRKLLTLVVFLPVLALPTFPWVFEPLLNQTMRLMGFRTGPAQLVLVSPEAFETLSDRIGLYGRKVDACPMSVGNHRMWLLPHGIVVWRGLISETDVSDRETGSPATMLPRDDVLVLPGPGLNHCS